MQNTRSAVRVVMTKPNGEYGPAHDKTERFAVPYRRTIVGQFMMNFNGLTSRRRL